jgi:hypothetical protein
MTVVLIQKPIGEFQEFNADQLQALCFKTCDYLTDESAPDCVGLD